jgi:DNA polymerase III alpha subunit
MLTPYAELHCQSNFSFLRGASHPEELVERALALEYTGLALTDECSFAGSVRAHLALKEARENDEPARAFRLIHGTEIRLTEGGDPKHLRPGAKLVLSSTSSALIAELRYEPYFLTVHDIVASRASAASCARAAARRPTRRSATASASPRSTRRA